MKNSTNFRSYGIKGRRVGVKESHSNSLFLLNRVFPFKGTMPIPDAKTALRTQMREVLNRLTPKERSAASTKARELLEKQTVWQLAKTIFFYAPLPEELDIWPLVSDCCGPEGRCRRRP